ncbi:MAG: hypothetical protein KGJ77_12930, partial [Acidobacteriota bacterium]|nr:hypothetical protein [Acidobacteriota bacterium]
MRPGRPPAVRRAAGALGSAAALFGAAGLVLAVAGPAWADTSTSPPSDGSGTGSSPASSPSSNLGGYTLSSSAAGLSVDYEQPNFPVPAKPTLELDVGYSSASYDAGPVGNANASALWPGPVVAGGGSQLPLLLDPYLEQYVAPLAPAIEPLVPNAGNWPVVATSAYPQGPATATNDNGPMAMHSSADQGASTATSSLALVGGPSSSLPAGLVTVQAVGSTSQDTVDALGDAVSEATSTVHGVDLAGGLIHIGTVSSTATSSSDGNQATLSGSSSVTGVTIAGQTVTIDSSGLHVMGNSQNLLGALVPSVNQALAAAGISLSLTNPTDTVQGPSGQRLLNGLQVHWDLSTYDQNFAALVAMLPSQLTSQLPLPPPYKQSITFDIGWAQVSADASPPFDASLGTADLG